jgi:hypothetical protein
VARHTLLGSALGSRIGEASPTPGDRDSYDNHQ